MLAFGSGYFLKKEFAPRSGLLFKVRSLKALKLGSYYIIFEFFQVQDM